MLDVRSLIKEFIEDQNLYSIEDPLVDQALNPLLRSNPTTIYYSFKNYNDIIRLSIVSSPNLEDSEKILKFDDDLLSLMCRFGSMGFLNKIEKIGLINVCIRRCVVKLPFSKLFNI